MIYKSSSDKNDQTVFGEYTYQIYKPISSVFVEPPDFKRKLIKIILNIL